MLTLCQLSTVRSTPCSRISKLRPGAALCRHWLLDFAGIDEASLPPPPPPLSTPTSTDSAKAPRVGLRKNARARGATTGVFDVPVTVLAPPPPSRPPLTLERPEETTRATTMKTTTTTDSVAGSSSTEVPPESEPVLDRAVDAIAGSSSDPLSSLPAVLRAALVTPPPPIGASDTPASGRVNQEALFRAMTTLCGRLHSGCLLRGPRPTTSPIGESRGKDHDIFY